MQKSDWISPKAEARARESSRTACRGAFEDQLSHHPPSRLRNPNPHDFGRVPGDNQMLGPPGRKSVTDEINQHLGRKAMGSQQKGIRGTIRAGGEQLKRSSPVGLWAAIAANAGSLIEGRVTQLGHGLASASHGPRKARHLGWCLAAFP
jgi:hypothetical protein